MHLITKMCSDSDLPHDDIDVVAFDDDDDVDE